MPLWYAFVGDSTQIDDEGWFLERAMAIENLFDDEVSNRGHGGGHRSRNRLGTCCRGYYA